MSNKKQASRKRKALKPLEAKQLYPLYLLSTVLVAAIAAALRTTALLTVFEAGIGFYSVTTLPIVTAALLVATAAALTILTYETRRHFAFSPDYRDLPTLFSGVFLGIVLLFFGVTLAIGSADLGTPMLLLSVLIAVAAATGAILFLLRGFNGAALGVARGMLALPLAALGILFALYLSFEGSMMLSSPPKLLAITAWVFVAFFFLGEARVALDRAKWPLHTAVTAITLILTMTLSVPNLVYHLTSGTPLLGNTAHDFAAFAVCLYSLSRLIATFSSALLSEKDATRYATDLDFLPAEERQSTEAPVATGSETVPESPAEEDDGEAEDGEAAVAPAAELTLPKAEEEGVLPEETDSETEKETDGEEDTDR